jgi:septal ring factor EnvC (AmiA/AmiB activator)
MIEETAEDPAMANENEDLRAEVARLMAENERLKKQLAETRAQRAEYLDALCRLMPPVELPTEDEMREQMKHMIPADQVLRELDEILKKNGGA